MAMKICIPLEVVGGETRVAAVPETVRGFTSAGLEVCVQAGAGAGATFDDASYETAGAGKTDYEALKPVMGTV